MPVKCRIYLNDKSLLTHTSYPRSKAWAALLSSEEEVKAMNHKRSEAVVTVSKEGEGIGGVSDEMNELIATLFECIESGGHQIRGSRLSSHTAAVMYATAATSAMSLIKIKPVGDGLSVGSWMKLAWTLLHPDAEIRTRLAENLFDILQTCPVHSRFLAYPCLLATDDQLHSQAMRVIFFAVHRLRRTHELLTQDAMADEEDDEAQRRAQDNMPETILPFLLYLLSYHPEFPTSDVLKDSKDERRLKQIVSIVRMVLRVLTETLSGEDNNLSYLIKQVGMISAYYDDAQDRDNIGLEYTMVLASKLLTELVKSDEHATEYHGEINLPSELFAPKPQARKLTYKASIETAGMDRMLQAGKDKKKGHARAGGGGGGAASRKRVVEVENETDDEDADENKPKHKRAKKATSAKSPATKAKAANAKAEAEAPSRDPGIIDRPKRHTAVAVSYREAAESEKEVLDWEERAAEQSMSSSKSSKTRTSTGSISILGSLGVASKATKRLSAGDNDDDDEMEEEQEEDEEMQVESDDDEGPKHPPRKTTGAKKVSLCIFAAFLLVPAVISCHSHLLLSH